MTKDDKRWLHVRLEIILEQAQAIRTLADTVKTETDVNILLGIVSMIRDVVQQSCCNAQLTK